MVSLSFRKWLNLLKEKFSNIEAVRDKGFYRLRADSLALMYYKTLVIYLKLCIYILRLEILFILPMLSFNLLTISVNKTA